MSNEHRTERREVYEEHKEPSRTAGLGIVFGLAPLLGALVGGVAVGFRAIVEGLRGLQDTMITSLGGLCVLFIHPSDPVDE